MSEYSQQAQDTRGLSGFDYTSVGTKFSEIGAPRPLRNRFDTFNLYDDRGKIRRDLGGWQIVFHDFSSQGLNHPEGPFEHNSNGFAWSDFITHRSNEMVPPPTTAATSVTGLLTVHPGFHGAFVFSVQFIATGAANAGLYKEASATDPTPVPITTAGAGRFCCLAKVLDDGVERLAAGNTTGPTKLYSDAVGTVATTMHTSTNGTWGIILSGLNATTPGVPVMLIYAGTTIGTKATDADLTTAITTTLTGLNAGGFAIGAITPSGREQRAYWAIPRATTTGGALNLAGEVMMDIWSTNMEGTDLLPHKLRSFPDGIKGAIPFRDGILAHDDTHVAYWDGQTESDLGLFRRRVKHAETTNTINSDVRRVIRSLVDNGPECGVIWQWYDANATLAGSVHFEMFNFETGSWHNFSPPYALTTTSAAKSVVLAAQGGAPLSPNTRHLYSAVNFISGGNESIRPAYVPKASESLLWQTSLGDGAVTTGIPTFNTSNKQLGCRYTLDGIERNPKVVTEVEFNGNLDTGGSGIWTLQVVVYGKQQDGTRETAYDKTFAQGGVSGDYIRKNTSAVNVFDVQPYFVATASGTTRKIAQLLPITIRGVYSKNPRKLVTAEQVASVGRSGE